MLALHGCIVGMDATYRTTQWGLPFFVLVVINAQNHGYPAAYFWVSSETTAAIAEALVYIKSMVHAWQPSVFIVDHSTAEFGAIELVFPWVFIILCDFHIKKAWQAWLKTECPTNKEYVYTLLKNIADSKTLKMKEAAMSAWNAFQGTSASQATITWFKNQYAGCLKHWCKADRAEIFTRGFNVNNHNEAQNRSLKLYLKDRSDYKVASMVRMLFQEITPQADLKHAILQSKELEVTFKKPVDPALIPEAKMFPRVVYNALEERLKKSKQVAKFKVEVVLAAQVYKICTDGGCYTTNLLEGTCDCPDFKQRRLICKHLFRGLAVCGKGITTLPDTLLKAPHMTFDHASSLNVSYDTPYAKLGGQGASPSVREHRVVGHAVQCHIQ